jgi:histone H2B
LRKINPAGTISSKAMNVLNDMICDLMERLATEAQSIREMNNKRTLNMRDIQTAARLMLPGQLSTHAFYEAHRAVRQLIVAQDDARRN